MFGTGGSAFGARPTGLFGSSTTTAPAAATVGQPQNPNSDFEIPSPPDDTVQALKFSPQVSGVSVFLAAGSWDNTVRVWQINENGTAEPKAMQNVGAPILAVDWFDDCTKVFMASADKMARVWDLASNTVTVVGQHDEAIRVCHWITAANYQCPVRLPIYISSA
ncbi:nucleoporin-17 [Aphelenchoides avenae]|nr:nucleoporin-17 [Aphelenchus avenae]